MAVRMALTSATPRQGVVDQAADTRCHCNSRVTYQDANFEMRCCKLRGFLVVRVAEGSEVSVCGQGIEKEYDELDTVWFMSGSLFDTYPYDTPTEAFSLKLFREVPCHRLLPPLQGWLCAACP